jgi:hypothetical protein
MLHYSSRRILWLTFAGMAEEYRTLLVSSVRQN